MKIKLNEEIIEYCKILKLKGIRTHIEEAMKEATDTLKECNCTKTLRYFENRFEKYDLVIADELGYTSFDREGTDL